MAQSWETLLIGVEELTKIENNPSQATRSEITANKDIIITAH